MGNVATAVAREVDYDDMVAAVKRAAGEVGLQYGTAVDVDTVGELHVHMDGEVREEAYVAEAEAVLAQVSLDAWHARKNFLALSLHWTSEGPNSCGNSPSSLSIKRISVWRQFYRQTS